MGAIPPNLPGQDTGGLPWAWWLMLVIVLALLAIPSACISFLMMQIVYPGA